METDLKKLLRSGKSVYSFREISIVLGDGNFDRLKKKVNRYVASGELIALRRGIYAKDENYDRMELATKILKPSYISLETVLRKEGVVFQHHESIFVVSYRTEDIDVDGQAYSFKKIKNAALTNPAGIKIENNYSIATKERAFLDLIYLHNNYYFDNLSQIDWNMCEQLLPMYENKAMERRFRSYLKKNV